MTVINFPTVTVVQRTRGATLFTLDIKVCNNKPWPLLSAYFLKGRIVLW